MIADLLLGGAFLALGVLAVLSLMWWRTGDLRIGHLWDQVRMTVDPIPAEVWDPAADETPLYTETIHSTRVNPGGTP